MTSGCAVRAAGQAYDADMADFQRVRPMSEAPKDGTLLILWIGADDDRENPLEDSEYATPTIGFNHFDDTGVDEWQFAGWDWNGDDFTKGSGTPIGWSRFPHRRFPRDHGTNVIPPEHVLQKEQSEVPK